MHLFHTYEFSFIGKVLNSRLCGSVLDKRREVELCLTSTSLSHFEGKSHFYSGNAQRRSHMHNLSFHLLSPKNKTVDEEDGRNSVDAPNLKYKLFLFLTSRAAWMVVRSLFYI